MYIANDSRYETMQYRNAGKSGLKLPAVSLGLWHNFGSMDSFETMRSMLRTAFDAGITHFDLANNYGPVPGSAEENFGKLLKEDFAPYRNELVISTKAGYKMWEGPYGEWGSRKYLLSSLDDSLKRMGLDYVDIFYHHRPDPNTPMEESLGALDTAVRQGKALYVGVSNYSAEETRRAAQILKSMGTPFIIHQPRYSIMDRWVEDGLLDVLGEEGIGGIAFCPLAQGLLTTRYLNGIPEDSRAKKAFSFLSEGNVTADVVTKAQKLNQLAEHRGQTLAQMALSWVLKDQRMTSVLIGASKPEQISENVKCIEHLTFTEEELQYIDCVMCGEA